MDRRQELLQLRADLERQIAEANGLADELAGLSLEAASEDAVTPDELLPVKEQLRVLLADCGRQLSEWGM